MRNNILIGVAISLFSIHTSKAQTPVQGIAIEANHHSYNAAGKHEAHLKQWNRLSLGLKSENNYFAIEDWRNGIGSVRSLFSVMANGNVGIGTSAPDKKLHIKSNGYAQAMIEGTTAAILHLKVEDSTIRTVLSGNEDRFSFQTWNNNTWRSSPLTILNSNGNVGIGTSTPEAKLHINNGNNSYGAILANSSEAAFSLYSKSLDRVPNTETFRIGLKHNTNENNGFISFYRGEDAFGGFLGFSTNGSERLRIQPDGNVGIGGSSPRQKLEISLPNAFNTAMEHQGQDHILFSASGISNGQYFGGLTWDSGGRRRAAIAAAREHNDHDFIGLAFFTRGTDGPGPMYESMRLSKYGNLGIGTKTPQKSLHVKGTNNYSQAIIEGGNSAGLHLKDNTGGIRPVLTGSSDGFSVQMWYSDNNWQSTPLKIKANGNIGIGTSDPRGYKLAVAGTKGIIAEEVTVKLQSNWPDYVFKKDYNLPSLEEVEKQIQELGHLANIPSAAVVAKEGVKLGDMNTKLLEKIEELTLYTIQQEKKIKAQKEKIERLEKLNKQFEDLEKRLKKLENNKE